MGFHLENGNNNAHLKTTENSFQSEDLFSCILQLLLCEGGLQDQFRVYLQIFFDRIKHTEFENHSSLR